MPRWIPFTVGVAVAALVAILILRGSGGDGLTDPSAGPATKDPTDPGANPATEDPNAGAAATDAGSGAGENDTGDPDDPQIEVRTPKSQLTADALASALERAREGATVEERKKGVFDAWVEYLGWGGEEGGARIRQRILDDLLTLHRTEAEVEVRRVIVRTLSPTGTDDVFTMLSDTARAGRTERDRIDAMRALGAYGQSRMATAIRHLHPDEPEATAAQVVLETLRERAATLLQELRPGAASDAERGAIDTALERLAR